MGLDGGEGGGGGELPVSLAGGLPYFHRPWLAPSTGHLLSEECETSEEEQKRNASCDDMEGEDALDGTRRIRYTHLCPNTIQSK